MPDLCEENKPNLFERPVIIAPGLRSIDRGNELGVKRPSFPAIEKAKLEKCTGRMTTAVLWDCSGSVLAGYLEKGTAPPAAPPTFLKNC